MWILLFIAYDSKWSFRRQTYFLLRQMFSSVIQDGKDWSLAKFLSARLRATTSYKATLWQKIERWEHVRPIEFLIYNSVSFQFIKSKTALTGKWQTSIPFFRIGAKTPCSHSFFRPTMLLYCTGSHAVASRNARFERSIPPICPMSKPHVTHTSCGPPKFFFRTTLMESLLLWTMDVLKRRAQTSVHEGPLAKGPVINS